MEAGPLAVAGGSGVVEFIGSQYFLCHPHPQVLVNYYHSPVGRTCGGSIGACLGCLERVNW